MRRNPREAALVRKRQKQSKQLHGHRGAEVPSKGHFRKRDAYDCGRPQCQLCHGEKIFGRPSANQRRADEAFKQGLQDVASSLT